MDTPKTDSERGPSLSRGDYLLLIEEDIHDHAFVYGKRVYGIVDVVPEVLHVGTLFWHVYWIPIAPVASYLLVVVPHGGVPAGCVRIGLSLKSVPCPQCSRRVAPTSRVCPRCERRLR